MHRLGPRATACPRRRPGGRARRHHVVDEQNSHASELSALPFKDPDKAPLSMLLSETSRGSLCPPQSQPTDQRPAIAPRHPSGQEPRRVETPRRELRQRRGHRDNAGRRGQSLPTGGLMSLHHQGDERGPKGVVRGALPAHDGVAHRPTIGPGPHRPRPGRRGLQTGAAEVVSSPHRGGQINPTAPRTGKAYP